MRVEPLWIGCQQHGQQPRGGHARKRMVGGGSAEGGAMHRVVLDWQTAHANLGKPIQLGERLCFGFHFYMQ